MRYAIIDNGVVVNVAISSDALEPNWVASDAAKIGDYFDGQNFSSVEPSAEIVVEITPRQGKIILSRYNILSSVSAHIDTLPGQEGEEARIDYECASSWRRDWPLLCSAAAALGLTDEQVDTMFLEASLI